MKHLDLCCSKLLGKVDLDAKQMCHGLDQRVQKWIV